MAPLDWQVIAEIATTVSTVAFAASAIVVVMQLRQAARERYFSVTAHLFEIWQSPEFQHDQLFLMHKLGDPNWQDFCSMGRGEHAERAIHRVGGYYDRVGNLVRHGLIRKDDILPTIGGYAVVVWHRIEPLVKELRLRENAILFENYEALLPECRECYVPGIERRAAPGVPTTAAPDRSIIKTAPSSQVPDELSLAATPAKLNHPGLATGSNWRSATEVGMEKTTIDVGERPALELSLPDTDGIVHRLSEFTAVGPAVLVYARGSWCPFCLRQLSDYAERYRDFKSLGIEVLAVSPESPRKSRRLRTGLKLPFTVLSDSKLDAARNFGLIGHEKPGEPTPATLLLDDSCGLKMSTLNQSEKCVVAGDMLDYVRSLKREPAARAVEGPKLERPKPGLLFVRGLANLATGFLVR